jgi:hypothetical protein
VPACNDVGKLIDLLEEGDEHRLLPRRVDVGEPLETLVVVCRHTSRIGRRR